MTYTYRKSRSSRDLFYQSVQEKVFEAMFRKGISVQEIAKAVGANPDTLCGALLDKRVSPVVCYKIVRFVDGYKPSKDVDRRRRRTLEG